MSRRVLRILVEVEGEAFDPDASNPYADTQVELDAVLNSNLQTITSMDAGDVVTLRDTRGNRCGKVECEDFPGDEPLLPYWTRLSDLALEVEDEFPVSAFIGKVSGANSPVDIEKDVKLDRVGNPQRYRPGGQKTEEPEPKVSYNEEELEAARRFDEGELAYPGEPSSHEHIATPEPGDPVIQTRPRRSKGGGGNANVPPPPGDPSMK